MENITANRVKLRKANLSREIVEVRCPESLNYPHIAITFGEDYANDLKTICNQVQAFREKYKDIY
jgi:hypothetical protein